MATSCHSNQSSYPIGTKTILFVPPANRCYMWNMARIGFMASEEMSFANVDDDNNDDDGRTTTDGRRMPGYTISSPKNKTYFGPFSVKGANSWHHHDKDFQIYVYFIHIILHGKTKKPLCIFHAKNLLRSNKLQFWKQIYFSKFKITSFIYFFLICQKSEQ